MPAWLLCVTGVDDVHGLRGQHLVERLRRNFKRNVSKLHGRPRQQRGLHYLLREGVMVTAGRPSGFVPPVSGRLVQRQARRGVAR